MSIYDQAKVFGPRLIDTFKNPIKAQHERYTTVDDGQGGKDLAWSVVREFDIAILPKSGADSFTTGRIESNTKVIAYAKHSDIPDFVDNDRITHDGRVYRLADSFDIAKAEAVIKFILDNGKAA